LLCSAFHAAIIHCGYDLLMQRGLLGMIREVNAGLAHDFHHLRGRDNYALYFTWWDRLLRTQSIPHVELKTEGSADAAVAS
jgi:sterol desaturase/sphingolipid hydroxylase (fatty acid hydroxylase superfamily)